MADNHPLQEFIKIDFPAWVHDYYLALGRFMTEFARVESIVSVALWSLVGVNGKTARAVFSGTRMDAAVGFINRLLIVKPLSPERTEILSKALTHAQAIAGIRNDIVHYGPSGITPEFVTISNRLVALTPENHLRERNITPDDLNRMAVDLVKIHNDIFWSVLDDRLDGITAPFTQSVLQAAWLYKPQPPKNGQKPRLATPQEPPPQPKPLEE